MYYTLNLEVSGEDLQSLLHNLNLPTEVRHQVKLAWEKHRTQMIKDAVREMPLFSCKIVLDIINTEFEERAIPIGIAHPELSEFITALTKAIREGVEYGN